MAICKYCQKPFAWGQYGDQWVPLVPIDAHDGLDRTFQDENGLLRASHRAVCVHTGGPTVKVTKLAHLVQASDVLPVPEVAPVVAQPKKRKVKRK